MKPIISKNIMAAAVASLVLAGGATTAHAEDAVKTADTGYCKIANNGCKGKSACASNDNACAGKNSCKGHGWVYLMKDNKKIEITKEECTKQSGTFATKSKETE